MSPWLCILPFSPHSAIFSMSFLSLCFMRLTFLIAYYLGILFFCEGQLFFLPEQTVHSSSAGIVPFSPSCHEGRTWPASLLTGSDPQGRSVASVGVTVQSRETFHSSSVLSWLHASSLVQVCEEREVHRTKGKESAQQG